MRKLIILFILPTSIPAICVADVTLPWSSTFNCSEWSEPSTNPNCDGLGVWGQNYYCSDSSGSHYGQITTAANYPGGGGGRGFRFWVGDGVAINSGGLMVNFTTGQTEVWVRWYMRYQAGFNWNPFIADKWIYFNNGTSYAVVPEYYGSDQVNIWTIAGGNHSASRGWNTTMGSSVSDGQWHAYEVHLKMDTNGSNGIGEVWIDGIQRLSYNNVNYGTNPNGWTHFTIEENKNKPQNGQCMYIDLDDVAVSNTGPIGPIGPLPAPAVLSPAAPRGLVLR